VHNGAVKVRTGTVLAFGLGYLLGSRAGRERYEQLVRAGAYLGRSDPISGPAGLVVSKSRAAVSLGVERLKDTIGVRLGWRNGDQAADAIAVDLAEDLAIALNQRRHRPEAFPPAPRELRRGPTLSQASSR
jgi:hypothetical protein